MMMVAGAMVMNSTVVTVAVTGGNGGAGRGRHRGDASEYRRHEGEAGDGAPHGSGRSFVSCFDLVHHRLLSGPGRPIRPA